MRVLIALGGNAMTGPDGSAAPGDQDRAVVLAMERVADLVGQGVDVLLTHGNGPQVGNILVKNEIAAGVVPPVPLDWCGAQTQGTIGFILLNALETALADVGCDVRPAALVSRTLVDSDDPGFAEPTKPIGRHLPHDEAAVLMEHGQVWQDRGEKGWRRIVASPTPREVLEGPAIAALLDAGLMVIAGGGGGIPVVREPDGSLRGVEAVIDKDLAAERLASLVGADTLVLLTGVRKVALDYGTPQQRDLASVTIAEAERYLAEGQFPAGSMGPKVKAATRFLANGGKEAIVTAPEALAEALSGNEGTRFVRE